MLVFRDGSRSFPARRLVEALGRNLQALAGRHSPSTLISSFLRAGELECALADAAGNAPALAAITDHLADAVVRGRAPADVPLLLDALARVPLPECLRSSPPEGFTFYALHPLDYAELLARAPQRGRAVVAGIRSIGATLSAIVAAACRARGESAERFTVRPEGHPWNRHTELSPEQRALVSRRAQDSDFFVADEGPGLSGSSFLSVAEALETAGVPRARITLLCSHQPEAERLCAPGAAQRWNRYRSLAAQPTRHLPADCGQEISGGDWRRVFLAGEEHWPASWTTMERRKFLSHDRRHFFKFEGHGAAGEEIRARAQALSEAGFGPAVEDAGEGFARYILLAGSPLALPRPEESVLDRLAAYCAFRATVFRSDAEPGDLAALVKVNFVEEFGCETEVEAPEVKRVVIPDARMQPHDWVRSPRGDILKTDGSGHGDDHFYPGPSDIAWDLAGTIVEWQLDPAAGKYFLDRYRARSGDDAQPRLGAWLRAYLLFRLGFCRMAADALAGTAEEPRLRREYLRYRAQLQSGSACALAHGARREAAQQS